MIGSNEDTNDLPLSSSDEARTTTHPLHLLDEFLEGRNQKTTSSPSDEKKQQDELLRATDFLMGDILEGALSVLDDASTTIRHVCAPHRSVYLVVRAGNSTKKTAYYYCQMTNHYSYCSCRSYLERSKTQHHALCKHLLALKLMSHLGISCPTENVSVEDFGTIVMLRAFND